MRELGRMTGVGSRIASQMSILAFFGFCIIALAGCSGGGGGGGFTSSFPTAGGGFTNSSSSGGGRGLGSVTIRIPFSDARAQGKLQGFPTSVDHVEVELFGPGVPEPLIRSVSRSDATATFNDVALGEKWLLAAAVPTSSNFLQPSSSSPLTQSTLPSNPRELRQTSGVGFLGLVRVDVRAGENNLTSQTLVADFDFVEFTQRTIGGITGVQLETGDESGSEFWTADQTGLLSVGNSNLQGNQLFTDNSPPARLIPLPFTDTVDQTYDFRTLSPSPMVIERCRRQVRLIGMEHLSTPLGQGPTNHFRVTETCTSPSSNQITETFVQDIWLREGIGPVLVGGVEGTDSIGLFQRRKSARTLAESKKVIKRQTSSSQFVSAEGILMIISRTPGQLSGELGNHFGIGNGTEWGVLSTGDMEF